MAICRMFLLIAHSLKSKQIFFEFIKLFNPCKVEFTLFFHSHILLGNILYFVHAGQQKYWRKNSKQNFFVEIESKYSKMISFGENKLKPQT